jgi:hypothetical protein
LALGCRHHDAAHIHGKLDQSPGMGLALALIRGEHARTDLTLHDSRQFPSQIMRIAQA